MEKQKWQRKSSFGGLRLVWELVINGELLQVARNYRATKRTSRYGVTAHVRYYEHNLAVTREFKTLRAAQEDALKEHARKQATA